MSPYEPYGAVPELVPRSITDAPSRPQEAWALLKPPEPPEPSLVSSGPGRIASVVMTIPEYAVRYAGMAAIYRDLIAHLGDDRDLLLAVHEHDAAVSEVQSWTTETPATILAIPEGVHFSTWAQDSFSAVEAGDGLTYIVEPLFPPRHADGLVPQHFAPLAGFQRYQVPLYFRGGNLLVGDEFVLVGKDYLWANDREYMQPGVVEAKFRKHLESERQILFVGTEKLAPINHGYPIEAPGTYQPAFHLDLFITLAGRSPESGRYRLLVGDPSLATHAVEEPPPEPLVRRFHEVATFLESSGFEVIRNPLPRVTARSSETKYLASSNNVLVEHDADGRGTVWLPTYGHPPFESLAQTDAENRRIWEEDLGFEVRLLTNYHPLAEKHGALNCITKIVARDQP